MVCIKVVIQYMENGFLFVVVIISNRPFFLEAPLFLLAKCRKL